MTIVLNDILRTTCNFILADGTLYQNIYTHRKEGVAPFADAVVVTALDTWSENMYARLEDFVDNGVNSALCSVDLIDWVVDAWEVVRNVGTYAMTFVPTDAFPQMPNQLSPYVVFKTVRPKTVGKKFLFPLCEDAYDVGKLTALAVADIVTYANDAVNDINLQVGDDLVPGVVRTGVNDWQEFTLALVGDIVGTQRRRRLGVGA